MKKLIFAAALAALLPLFVSCGDTDNTEQGLKEPRFVQYAGQLIPADPDPSPSSSALTKAGAVAPALAYLEFTESGIYVVGEKTDGETEYRTGTYNVSGDTYSLAGFGAVEFPRANPGQVSVNIRRDNGSAETIKATFTKASVSADRVNSGWTVDKTRVTVRGWTTASADFRGCNISEIIDFLQNNGHTVPDDVSPNLAISSISFTGTDSIIFAYSDGFGDVGTYRFSGASSFTYTWKSDKMGYTFLTNNGTVEYMDGKCILTINVSIQDSTTTGSVTFVLSQMA